MSDATLKKQSRWKLLFEFVDPHSDWKWKAGSETYYTHREAVKARNEMTWEYQAFYRYVSPPILTDMASGEPNDR